MKKSFLLMLAVAALLVAQAGLAQEATQEDSTRTLNGEFSWKNNADGALEAVFTRSGENEWEVAFHFEFRGTPHTYSGTASGNLTDGKLAGEVQNEDKKRTFTFEGKFKDGTFSGTHAEITGGNRRDTGTISLAG